MPTLSPNLLTTPPAPAGKNAANPGKAEAAPEQAFGNVLARQLNAEQPPAETTATGTGKTGRKLLAVEVGSDSAANNAAALPGNDPTANLIAMLQAPVELRPLAGVVQAETAAKAEGKGEQLLTGQTRAAARDGKPLAAAHDTALNGTQKTADSNPALEMSPLKDARPAPEQPLPETLAAAPRAQDVAAFDAPALNATPPAAQLPSSAPVTVATPMGSSVWSDDFAQQITWMATGKLEQSASLHLNPPDLGPMQVVVKVSDSQATVLFSSPHGAVREAIESALPKLRELMADNGITLGNASVSDQSPRERGNADEQAAPRRSAWEQDDGALGRVQAGSAVGVSTRQRGMLDTYA